MRVNNIKNRLLENTRKMESYDSGRGTWYQRANGDRIGVRDSKKYGETLDFNVKGLLKDFKIHQE